MFFVVALLGALGVGVYFTHKKGRTVLNLVLLSTLMILIGYSSYASVTIRAAGATMKTRAGRCAWRSCWGAIIP